MFGVWISLRRDRSLTEQSVDLAFSRSLLPEGRASLGLEMAVQLCLGL